MVTPLEESILEGFYKFVEAIGKKKFKEADKFYEDVSSLLDQEPLNTKLFIPFIEMLDAIHEYGDDYPSLVAAYNALVYEFKKIKYPDKY